jgi:hypothetical protein
LRQQKSQSCAECGGVQTNGKFFSQTYLSIPYIFKIKLEENPGSSQHFKTDRKPRTPRESQKGNKVEEFKRLSQQAASPVKLTRGGGSIKKKGNQCLTGKETNGKPYHQ